MTIVVTTDEDLRRIIRDETRELREAIAALAAKRVAPPSGLLTVEAVASRCSVTSTTVRSWIHSGELSSQRAGRRYVVREVDLEAFLARAQASDAPEPKQHLATLINRINKTRRST